MVKAKRVIIQTDFTVNSLNIVVDLLDRYADQHFEIILIHGLQSDNSITELLGFHPEDHLEDLQTEEFIKACQLMRSKYGERINEMYADIITSQTDNYFKNYFRGNRIDHLVVAKDFRFEKVTPKSFDLLATFNRNSRIGLSVIYLDTQSESIPVIDKLDSLFFRRNWNVTF
ncbi:hypothetical protein [Sphingobacterium pedocola]|uniref:UspA domain-containing protein n=1 Tax=Sphingobacterium pedocola TaxID=2082722 RepID=A0ABR9T8Y5_9SPHI|nr:hypothetical protein [Sphingobacterium pedocola]MBE8721087.1 hypothetical protein [Sphingobacterium pedocola]